MAKVKGIGALRTASFMALYGIFLGIIIDAVSFPFSAMISVWMVQFGALSFLSLPMIMLAVPLIFGVMNFILGLIFAGLMNLILMIIGGISFKLELGNQIY